MSPELTFVFILLARMAITAAFVVAATVAAERAGPLIGGLVATLPVAAGPVYVFLAIEHDAGFIAAGAITTLAINIASVTFALVYVLMAQRRSLRVSFGTAFAVWLALAWLINAHHWTLTEAIVANLIVVPICVLVARPMRHVRIPPTPLLWSDIILRAAAVALMVTTVVAISFRIGPESSGILAVFPIVLISVMIIMHRRAGGPAAAAVLANAILGLVGFGFASLMLHFAVLAFGSAIGLTMAAFVSVAWGLLVFAARRLGVPV